MPWVRLVLQHVPYTVCRLGADMRTVMAEAILEGELEAEVEAAFGAKPKGWHNLNTPTNLREPTGTF